MQEPLARTRLQVRYHECDPQGVVFNAHYLAYADMASFECVRAVLGPYSGLTARGVDMVVAESNVRYWSPCRFEDELVVVGVLDRLGTTSMVLRFPMYRGDELVAEVTNRYVWISTQTAEPMAPPDDIREALAAYAPEA